MREFIAVGSEQEVHSLRLEALLFSSTVITTIETWRSKINEKGYHREAVALSFLKTVT